MPKSPDTLFTIARLLNDAWVRGDSTAFVQHLSSRFVDFKSGFRVDKAGLVNMVRSSECAVRSWGLDDPQVAVIEANVYVLSYAGTFDGSCAGPDGARGALLSPTRSVSIFVREAGSWAVAFHSENKVDTTAAPSVVDDPALEAAATDLAGNANTAELMNLHSNVWRALVTKDRGMLDRVVSARLSLVDPEGSWVSGRDAVLRGWPTGTPCVAVHELVTSNGVATDLAPGVELLTVRVSVDGSCGARTVGARHQSAVYVRQGNEWRLAFIIDSFAR